jgi:hypothetical protein
MVIELTILGSKLKVSLNQITNVQFQIQHIWNLIFKILYNGTQKR